jgi:hypothetical protein
LMVIKSGGDVAKQLEGATRCASALVEVAVALSLLSEAAVDIRQKKLDSYNHHSNDEADNADRYYFTWTLITRRQLPGICG